MTDESVFYRILKGVAEEKESIKTHLATGGAKTPEEYWCAVGKYSAFSVIEMDVKELEQRYLAE